MYQIKIYEQIKEVKVKTEPFKFLALIFLLAIIFSL